MDIVCSNLKGRRAQCATHCEKEPYFNIRLSNCTYITNDARLPLFFKEEEEGTIESLVSMHNVVCT
jgi:hypothetical protein